jgi:anti-anti-sigma factor
MEGALDIQQSVSGKTTLLALSGRLDANWAGQLADTINALTREGIYDVSLDLTNVVYLSSAGIRVLVMQYKNLDRLGGSLTLAALSDQVREVLQMVGMTEMMSGKPEKAKEPDAPVTPGMAREGFQFTRESIGTETMRIKVHGDPEISPKKVYSDQENRVIEADGHCFALGLGAIGTGFEDCKPRYGEFLALGDAVTYMPADQSSIPDYAIASGQYVPSVNALFAIQATGEFTDRVIFEPAAGSTSIPLHKLIDALISFTGYKKLALLMIAESDGLIGMRLRKSPATDPSLLELPGLRDNLFFTTEPAYPKMLTVSFGYFEPINGPGTSAWVRPLQNGSSVAGHLHSAVFPYQPLKKSEPDYHEIIRSLFGDSEVIDILHLLNDTREINGLGDSRFKNGICWIGRIA